MDDQVTQLNGLREALRAITGKEPAPTEVQRLMALARVLGMRTDDGMLPILAVLDTYHGIFSRLPAEMQASAKAAADGAAEQAKARINEAVAHLVPSVENAVARAAENTVRRVHAARSLWSVAVVVMVLAAVFGIGELVGVGFLAAVQDARANISWTDAFGPLSWRAALAGASVAMGFWWYYGDEDGKKAWIPFIIGGFGIGMLLWKAATGIF
jgi:hypothetical protein